MIGVTIMFTSENASLLGTSQVHQRHKSRRSSKIAVLAGLLQNHYAPGSMSMLCISRKELTTIIAARIER